MNFSKGIRYLFGNNLKSLLKLLLSCIYELGLNDKLKLNKKLKKWSNKSLNCLGIFNCTIEQK